MGTASLWSVRRGPVDTHHMIIARPHAATAALLAVAVLSLTGCGSGSSTGAAAPASPRVPTASPTASRPVGPVDAAGQTTLTGTYEGIDRTDKHGHFGCTVLVGADGKRTFLQIVPKPGNTMAQITDGDKPAVYLVLNADKYPGWDGEGSPTEIYPAAALIKPGQKITAIGKFTAHPTSFSAMNAKECRASQFMLVPSGANVTKVD